MERMHAKVFSFHVRYKIFHNGSSFDIHQPKAQKFTWGQYLGLLPIHAVLETTTRSDLLEGIHKTKSLDGQKLLLPPKGLQSLNCTVLGGGGAKEVSTSFLKQLHNLANNPKRTLPFPTTTGVLKEHSEHHRTFYGEGEGCRVSMSLRNGANSGLISVVI